LENYKQQKQSLSPLLKLTKKIFKSTTIDTLSSTIDRPNWIKFSIIYILLGIETIKQQDNNEYIELATVMIFKLLKKLSKEVSQRN
jgi:hypothetical protein